MAEENDVKVPNDGKEIPDGQPSWTPAEERALADGWNPDKDEMDDPDAWVTAKEFNFRGELMSRISAQGKKLSKLEGDNATLGHMVKKANEMTQKMTEAAVKKAVRALKLEKMEAVRDGDAERVLEIDDQIEDITADTADTKQEPDTAPAAGPDFSQLTPQQRAWVDFVTTTPWAQDPKTHPQLLAYADKLLDTDPNMPVGDMIGELNEYGRRQRSQTRANPPGPDNKSANGRQAPKSKSKFSASDLDPMEASIAAEFVADGTIKSLDAYAELLGKEGNLVKQSR